MRQFTQLEFIRIVRRNDFSFNRYKGDHAIYTNDKGRHISIPNRLKSVIAERLIKENKLNINKK